MFTIDQTKLQAIKNLYRETMNAEVSDSGMDDVLLKEFDTEDACFVVDGQPFLITSQELNQSQQSMLNSSSIEEIVYWLRGMEPLPTI